MGAVPRAVPSAVAPSVSGNNVEILTGPQLGPYQPMTGNPVIPVVPRTDDGTAPAQPHFTSPPETGHYLGLQEDKAPSVDVNGFMWQPGPQDPHYTNVVEVKDPYGKVNNPPTRGMFTWVKEFVNHIAQGPQNVDPNGFRAQLPQQRVSVMRITPPPHGSGFAPQTFIPKQLPQHANTAKFMPAVGTQAYGVTQVNGGTGSAKGVLNRDTYGAGQTAGGIGGNQYTPAPGPPATTSTAPAQANPSGMPTWG